MVDVVECSEDAARTAVDALAATLETSASDGRIEAEESITRLTDLALDVYSQWPATAPTVEIRGLLTLLKRARDAYARGESEDLDLALVGIRTVVARLRRQRALGQVEDPEAALAFLDASLKGWTTEDLARVVGAQPRVLSNWRSGTAPRKQALERLQLVAELVVELRTAMTARGVRMWFDNPVPQLDGQSPFQILEEGDSRSWTALVEFARGGLR